MIEKGNIKKESKVSKKSKSGNTEKIRKLVDIDKDRDIKLTFVITKQIIILLLSFQDFR